jgi:microcystin-dependent protein
VKKVANISEQEIFDEAVREVGIDDPVAGGISGPVNILGKALANRTKWLKAQIALLVARAAALETLIGSTSMNDVLLKAENLADVPDKAQARTNLGVSAVGHDHDSTYLKKSLNLSDVESATAAKTNLGVADIHFVSSAPGVGLGKNGDIAIQEVVNATPIMYKRENGVWIPTIGSQNTEIPGVFKWFAGPTAPAGYLKCNGQAVSRTTYAALFNAIGTRYGLGDGSNTFNLPDVRGNVIRGYDDGRGIDPGRALGSEQADQNKGHTHSLVGTKADAAGSHNHAASTGGAGGHAHSGAADANGSHVHSVSVGNYSGGAVRISSYETGTYHTEMNTNAAGTHTHTLSINGVGDHTHSVSIGAAGAHEHNLSGSVQPEGGTEARMRNIAFIGIIKF